MKPSFRFINTAPATFNKWILVLSIALLGAFSLVAWFLQRQFPTIEAEQSLSSNISFFLLINLNIIVVLILAFLVVKNIIKLSLDRRRKILGAKLRTRLVVAFVGLSLIPTVLLFTVAKGIVERVLQGWFSPQVEASVDGSVRVARLYYEEAESELHHFGVHLRSRLVQIAPLLLSGTGGSSGSKDSSTEALGTEAIEDYLEEKRQEYGLFDISLYDYLGNRVLRVRSAERSVSQPAVNLASLRRARDLVQVNAEQSLTAEFLRVYVPVAFELPIAATTQAEDSIAVSSNAFWDSDRFVLVATKWVSPKISSTLASVIASHDDYRELRSYRQPLASSYFLTLVIVTLLIIFAAVWVGFYLARGISVPIGLLAEGTQQVAHGNLGYRIPEVGDDELSVLVRSFNTMTTDLQGTTGELVQRRRYMETLLAQVGVGVLSLGLDGSITTCNDTARNLLTDENTDLELLLGAQFSAIAAEDIAHAVDDLKSKLSLAGQTTISANVSRDDAGGANYLHLSLTSLVGETGEALGYVLLLDDISDLISAQRMAAWREVARRIAHEIKNPLTPIQLSAQRVQRRMLARSTSASLDEQQFILDATSTIVKQVEILRTLVNEFSRFARMPKTSLATADIRSVIQEVVQFFSSAHPDITFRIREAHIPEFQFDVAQISRVLTNLIDNSVAAIEAARGSGLKANEVTIATEVLEDLSMVSVSVEDNGQGVNAADRARMFEPYFSTKQSGTGLGLAIVSTIIADHRGYIRVSDIEPHGTRITFELPLRISGFGERLQHNA